MPLSARHLDEVQVQAGGPQGRLNDVELPYRRLGRCRLSDAAAAVIGTQRAQVAVALSIYEARNGKHATTSELLGRGVDLGVGGDAPEILQASTAPGSHT
jgi:hypothetical protein